MESKYWLKASGACKEMSRVTFFSVTTIVDNKSSNLDIQVYMYLVRLPANISAVRESSI